MPDRQSPEGRKTARKTRCSKGLRQLSELRKLSELRQLLELLKLLELRQLFWLRESLFGRKEEIMKNLSDSRKIFAVGSLILGVLLLLWPGGALRAAAYAVGLVIMAVGLTAMISFFRGRRGGSLLSLGFFAPLLVIGAGGWIFLNPEDFVSIIPTAIGFLIVFSGIINLLETFFLSRARDRKWWVSLLAAIATIFMGMLLVNHAFGIASTMVRLGGCFLIFNGLSDLWINNRVDEYVYHGDPRGGRGNGRRGSSRRTGSGSKVIDAENYREMK